MQVRFEEEMVCAIFQHSRDISEKQGKYIDVKLEPERIGELPEAKEWPALGQLLNGINRTNLFRTTGCNSNYDEVPGGHAAPFVDVALDDPRLRHSEEACSKLREKLVALDGHAAADGLVIELVQSEATMPDGEVVPSTRIWFIGERAQAEAAFPLIVSALDGERVPDYLKCGSSDVVLRGNDGPFAPITLVLDLTTFDGDIAGAYACDSYDHYGSWEFTSERISIVVTLGEVNVAPQWNAFIVLGDDKAHYQGEVMTLPVRRWEARLKKLQGGARWPDVVTLEMD